jgi:hypothetical protein
MDQNEHNPGDHEDPLIGPMWIIGFLGAVLLTVIVFGLTAIKYNAADQEIDFKVIQRDPAELEQLRTQQLAPLSIATPRWVNDPPLMEGEEPTRRLTIPLEQAMEIVVKEASQR